MQTNNQVEIHHVPFDDLVIAIKALIANFTIADNRWGLAQIWLATFDTPLYDDRGFETFVFGIRSNKNVFLDCRNILNGYVFSKLQSIVYRATAGQNLLVACRHLFRH